ncbi:DUF2254 domain-containing protein [Novosphingobium resinovorum]|uniref:DUF2254 domain-containing protein n=1 Tax=Novosphingobium TaxID=165696 RepID=UPI00200399A5|nr:MULTISPECIES: DUF2254 domain-containing protein [Novosphingobium]WJM25797.1 DUF2254 domain-containing protein [Novosphingobium resinovorum]
MKQWQWALRLLTRRMWFRAALFCFFALALSLAGALAGHTISYEFAASVGAQSVDNILNVLASSMLAVTTFSLTAMVSAYAGATSNITPRAVQLLVDDTTAQNALATFLGSFLFAVAGIIALSTGLYGETGRVILLAGTILVIVVIVITFLRWIQHITQFGRVGDTIGRVERAASRAVEMMALRPRFGTNEQTSAPHEAIRIVHPKIGRITHIDIGQLGDVARDTGAVITLSALPGAFAEPGRVIAWSLEPLDQDQRARIVDAFTVSPNRAFDHDPRFGLVVLSEIASRALSPAVNDPGTAIAVIEAGTRILAAMLRHEPKAEFAVPAGVYLPPFNFSDLIEDIFRPISRDGAGVVEVGIRLQKALGSLASVAAEAHENCRNEAADALERACEGLSSQADREHLLKVYEDAWGGMSITG